MLRTFSILSIVAAFTFLAALIACGDEGDHLGDSSTAMDSESETAAFTLLAANCFSCHSPQPGTDNRIAPPMANIKTRYLSAYPEREDFVEAMTVFMEQPTTESALMPGAVEKFGLMPVMSVPPAQLHELSTYIYDEPLESEEWFQKRYVSLKNRLTNEKAAAPFIERAQDYVLATKGTLGKNLMYALNNEGTEAAISFCNERAYHLTDSMGKALGNIKIRRVSDQARNPANQADADQLEYIRWAKEQLAQGDKPAPQFSSDVSGLQWAYFPITTNDMCLQCHGLPNEQIEPDVLAKIDEFYPDDQATGYGANELRGIWVVEDGNETDDDDGAIRNSN